MLSGTFVSHCIQSFPHMIKLMNLLMANRNLSFFWTKRSQLFCYLVMSADIGDEPVLLKTIILSSIAYTNDIHS